MGSPKSEGFVAREPWMSAQHFVTNIFLRIRRNCRWGHRKGQGIARDLRIHPLGTMTIFQISRQWTQQLRQEMSRINTKCCSHCGTWGKVRGSTLTPNACVPRNHILTSLRGSYLHVQTSASAQRSQPSSICTAAALRFNTAAIGLAHKSRPRQIPPRGVDVHSQSSPWRCLPRLSCTARKPFFSHWYSDGRRTERDTITQWPQKMILGHKSHVAFVS